MFDFLEQVRLLWVALLLHMTKCQFVQTNLPQSAASGLDKGDWGINWRPGESGFQVTKHQTSKPNTKSAIPNSNSRSFVANLLITFPDSKCTAGTNVVRGCCPMLQSKRSFPTSCEQCSPCSGMRRVAFAGINWNLQTFASTLTPCRRQIPMNINSEKELLLWPLLLRRPGTSAFPTAASQVFASQVPQLTLWGTWLGVCKLATK